MILFIYNMQIIELLIVKINNTKYYLLKNLLKYIKYSKVKNFSLYKI